MRKFTIKVACIALAIGATSLDLMGQDAKAKKLDKLYERNGYQVVLDNYSTTKFKTDSTNQVPLAQLVHQAESYRLTGNYAAAASYYGQLVEKTDKAEFILKYAQCLQVLGQYEQAKASYLAYDAQMGATDPQGKYQAEACGRLDRFANREGLTIENLALNTEKLDMSPYITSNGLYFSSNRANPTFATNHIDIWMEDNFMDVWLAPREGEKLGAASPLLGDLNSKFHEGALSTLPGDEQIVFTRNLYFKGKRKFDGKKVTRLGIYFAQKSKTGEWVNVTQFPYNTQDHSYCHPTISEDGQRLYYASDRPGGYGGYDIYYSKLEDGVWGEPTNLGDQINSAGDEHFPIFNRGVLYYASKGLGGLGGYDMFYASSMVEGESVDFAAPINLGTPLNSSYDDFGFMPEGDGSTGYFTSNRPGGKGMDDIYRYKLDEPVLKQKVQQTLSSSLCVYDKSTNKRIANANISLRLPDGSVEQLKTDKDGKVSYNMTTSSAYEVTANAATYKGNKQQFETEAYYADGQFEYCIPLETSRPKDCFLLSGSVLNGTYNNQIIPNAKVTLQDRCTGDVIEVMSDENGAFEFCLKCGCDYMLKGEKGSMTPDSKIVIISTEKCPAGKANQDLVLKTTKLSEVASAYDILGEGLVLELTNIYYDFNEFYIRDDAKPELDKLVRLMNAFPTMEIELSSHTDARASVSYNNTLSQNRASAARDYLISRGINASRIVARGFGENQPRNNCRDGVNCSEEQHQYNRRTEVRITKFDNKDVKVEYLDNKPGYIDPKPGK